ncbi:hypothetical protein PSTT_02259 [Puccinia striiformis]|uniref:Uncharacterized protein n=1 Tax=Puccinia striiformis TaxID=27350 RepID=A0A2S4W0J3_9BASI|nr:hypothetical protein PSTT_02259 [Puccinia striiformis]
MSVAPPEVYSKPINRTIMMSDHLNATGLSPEESRKLKSRSERDDEKTIIRCLKEVSRKLLPTIPAAFSDAHVDLSPPIALQLQTVRSILRDTIATPLSTIKSQFNGMPKMFSSSTIDKFEVLESPPSLPTPPGPDQFTVINQDITYYRSGKRDPKGKVIRHTEEWSHDKVTDKSDGFIGQLNEWRKKAAAEVIAKLVPEEPPKDKQS